MKLRATWFSRTRNRKLRDKRTLHVMFHLAFSGMWCQVTYKIKRPPGRNFFLGLSWLCIITIWRKLLQFINVMPASRSSMIVAERGSGRMAYAKKFFAEQNLRVTLRGAGDNTTREETDLG